MKQTPKIIALGDSLTYGYPFGHKLSWVQFCNDAIGLNIINQGQNGQTLKDLAARILPDVVDFKPDYCILSAGTNDIISPNFSLDSMKERFETILNECKRSQIQVIVALPPPINNPDSEKLLAKYRRYIKKTAKAQDLPILDFYKVLMDKKTKLPQEDLYEDDIHPNSEGYRAMSQVCIQYFQNLFNPDAT